MTAPEVLVELEGLLKENEQNNIGAWWKPHLRFALECLPSLISAARSTEAMRASFDALAAKLTVEQAAYSQARLSMQRLAEQLEAMRAENERLKGSPWVTEEGFRDTDDLLDMGRVGQSLLERIDDVRRCKGWEHWLPADDPAEIVCDLANALADAEAEGTRLRDEIEATRFLITGGEDAPGHIASLPFSEIQRVADENLASWHYEAERAEALALKLKAAREALEKIRDGSWNVASAIHRDVHSFARHALSTITPTGDEDV